MKNLQCPLFLAVLILTACASRIAVQLPQASETNPDPTLFAWALRDTQTRLQSVAIIRADKTTSAVTFFIVLQPGCTGLQAVGMSEWGMRLATVRLTQTDILPFQLHPMLARPFPGLDRKLSAAFSRLFLVWPDLPSTGSRWAASPVASEDRQAGYVRTKRMQDVEGGGVFKSGGRGAGAWNVRMHFPQGAGTDAPPTRMTYVDNTLEITLTLTELASE